VFDIFWGNWAWIRPYHDEILAVATAFIAIFTIALVWVAWLQMRTTKIIERAYVSVRPLGTETFRTKDNVIGLLSIQNSGRLPARKISWALYRDCDTDRRRKHFPVKKSDFVGNNILVSGGEIIKGTGPIPIADFSKIIVQKPQVYVWGAIRYHSGFGIWRRTLQFCHRYDVSGVVPDDAGMYHVPATEGRHHEYGNSSD